MRSQECRYYPRLEPFSRCCPSNTLSRTFELLRSSWISVRDKLRLPHRAAVQTPLWHTQKPGTRKQATSIPIRKKDINPPKEFSSQIESSLYWQKSKVEKIDTVTQIIFCNYCLIRATQEIPSSQNGGRIVFPNVLSFSIRHCTHKCRFRAVISVFTFSVFFAFSHSFFNFFFSFFLNSRLFPFFSLDSLTWKIPRW